MTTCAYKFLIQSEFTPTYVDERIEAFLVCFHGMLEEMSDSEFGGYKRSLINDVLEKPTDLSHEASRHWTQVSNECYDLEFYQLDAAAVEQLTKAEIMEFYEKYFLPTSPTRSHISVHLHANSTAEHDSRVDAAIEKVGHADIPSDKRSSTSAVESAVEIKDVHLFKASLSESPQPHAVKDLSEFEEKGSKLC